MVRTMLNNDGKINVDVMQDASEIVRYDETGIPLYIQTGELSRYPDRKALCHWHDDLEFIRIVPGEMKYNKQADLPQIPDADSGGPGNRI